MSDSRYNSCKIFSRVTLGIIPHFTLTSVGPFTISTTASDINGEAHTVNMSKSHSSACTVIVKKVKCPLLFTDIV